MPEIKIQTIDHLDAALIWARKMITKGLQAGQVVLILERESRTADQNDKCHPMIRDIARQMNHPILKQNEDQWRYFLIGNMQGQLMVPSLDGSQVIVVPKKGTKRMNKPEMSDFIEYLYFIGSEYNIKWSDPSLAVFDEYRQVQ